MTGQVFALDDSFFHQEPGRTHDERTILLIKNGHCIGYHFTDETDQSYPDESAFKPLLADEDARMILKNYFGKKKGKR